MADERALGLVHDYLLVMRGAERTFADMAGIWPGAPVATLLYDPDVTASLPGHTVHASRLQSLGVRQGGFRRLLPLFRPATERLPVDNWDLVVSSSSAFAHGIRPARGAVHVCYCHSPFRYAWHERRRAEDEIPPVLKPAIRSDLRRHRRWDRHAAERVTHYVANSHTTRSRIRRFLGRDAHVVHPPVDIDRFRPAEPEDFFLVVGEVTEHKRTELALEAARRAGARLKVVGAGPLLPGLRDRYPEAEFLGRVDDAELADLYARCRALVVPNVEDFGIAAVEAQASGRPVIAAGEGGSLETVAGERTGLFFGVDDVAGLADAMRADFDAFDTEDLRRHANGFSRETFRRRLRDVVVEACMGAGRPDLAWFAEARSDVAAPALDEDLAPRARRGAPRRPRRRGALEEGSALPS